MGKQFLEEHVPGQIGFRVEALYNAHGDCVTFKIADEASVRDRLDSVLTLYRSAIDERVIGFQLKDVAALRDAIGAEAFQVKSARQGDKLVSVSLLLLMAFNKASEKGEIQRNRLKDYDTVMHDVYRAGEVNIPITV